MQRGFAEKLEDASEDGGRFTGQGFGGHFQAVGVDFSGLSGARCHDPHEPRAREQPSEIFAASQRTAGEPDGASAAGQLRRGFCPRGQLALVVDRKMAGEQVWMRGQTGA